MQNITWQQILASITGIIILIITWIFLFGLISLNTEAFLVPYDTVPTTERPILGNYERSINDFFETSPGAELPAIIFITISIIIYIIRYLREKNKINYSLHWEFATINGLYLFSNMVVVIMINQLFCNKLCSMGFNWPVIIAMVVLTILYYYIQYKGLFKLFKKKQNIYF